MISKLHLQLPKMDTVALSPHLISDQTLTKWFVSLERLMKYSVAKSIFDLIDEKVSEKVDQSVGKDPWREKKHPSQIILLVEHFLFVLQCEKLVSTGSRTPLLNLKYQVEEQFQHIQLEQRSRDLAFLSQRLYFRDLLTSEIRTFSTTRRLIFAFVSFRTARQCRWIECEQFRMVVGSEVSHRSDRVHREKNSPSTVRQSNHLPIRISQCVDLRSVSAVGKDDLPAERISPFVSSVDSSRSLVSPPVLRPGKHFFSSDADFSRLASLSQCCGINLVELLCDPSIGLEQIANVHRGLIGSNSWIFFSNFDRLSAECLSILSSSIQHVRIQLEQSKDFFQRQETNLRKWKSQPNLLLFHRPAAPDNEFPTKNSDRLSLLTEDSTLIPFPLTYGLFGSRSSISAPPPLPTSIKFDCRLVSHCSPDLQHLIRSLLYQHRVFSMKEQEDCRETSENLFHLIESFRHLVRLLTFSLVL